MWESERGTRLRSARQPGFPFQRKVSSLKRWLSQSCANALRTPSHDQQPRLPEWPSSPFDFPNSPSPPMTRRQGGHLFETVSLGTPVASHLRKKRTSLEKATVMAKNKIDAPVVLSTDEARAGVTGHHVRYVHAFGLLGTLDRSQIARPS